ncbi:Pyruvate/Phosphoenolpyruvate kinase-like domain-containing protein [Gloeopeniophorella convolvens]|nr:Pyruvate/Phosphoenolpyruvate kinase-like domain-containing protein [Gloeopeniophorella convolvens]
MSNTTTQASQPSSTAFGAWISLPGAHNARTVASSSKHLSWVLLDCEHGLIPLVPGAAECIQAIAGLGPSAPRAFVRISATGAAAGAASWQIKHALDAGAAGVIVPMVGTAAQAREIVADSRFPPVGRRGFGSMYTHGVWGMTPGEYLLAANAAVLVMVQIETREAVDNVEEIAAVEGVDALFIGPFDLSISLGFPPPSPDPHPEVEKIIQKIKTVTHAAGKKVAIYCTSGPQAAARAKEGFDLVNVATDAAAMSASISASLEAAATQSQGQTSSRY